MEAMILYRLDFGREGIAGRKFMDTLGVIRVEKCVG